MKAIILAAGEGTRLKRYTKDLPKGMLKFNGRTLIERQIDSFKSSGIDEIIVVKGFLAEKINYPDVEYVVNPSYDSTNMLASLLCAEEFLSGTVIVSYADIIFDDNLLESLIARDGDVIVSVDTAWENYWIKRHGSAELDSESLVLDGDIIVSLGVEAPLLKDIDARYVGLLKFSERGIYELKRIWHKSRDAYWDLPWQVSGKSLSKAYLTDMLQAMIDEGIGVQALKVKGGWMEFDTNEDYELALKWLDDGTITELLKDP